LVHGHRLSSCWCTGSGGHGACACCEANLCKTRDLSPVSWLHDPCQCNTVAQLWTDYEPLEVLASLNDASVLRGSPAGSVDADAEMREVAVAAVAAVAAVNCRCLAGRGGPGPRVLARKLCSIASNIARNAPSQASRRRFRGKPRPSDPAVLRVFVVGSCLCAF
jgi:hypothetical protein